MLSSSQLEPGKNLVMSDSKLLDAAQLKVHHHLQNMNHIYSGMYSLQMVTSHNLLME